MSALTVILMDLTISGSTAGGITAPNPTVTTRRLTLWRCTLTGNHSAFGGGIFMGAGSLEVNASTLQGNSATYRGGGIYANGPLTLRHTILSENTAGDHGGGVHGNQGLVTVEGGSFDGNYSSGNGGGINMHDQLTLIDVVFSNNRAGGWGGGVLQWNGDVPVQLTNVTFQSNTTGSGGGGMWARGDMTVKGGSFLSNTAGGAWYLTNGGGGLFVEGGSLSLTGTLFEGNKAGGLSNGGGLALNSSNAVVQDAVFRSNIGWNGGGIYGSLTVERTTFANNEAGYGGGLRGVNVTVRDSLFEGNTVSYEGAGLEVDGTSLLERVRVTGNQTLYGKASGLGIGWMGYYGSTTTIRNSVFVGNQGPATGTELRGVIVTDTTTQSVMMEFVTIANNTGANVAGLLLTSGHTGLKNVIIANQAVGICIVQGPNIVSASVDSVLWSGNFSDTGSGVTGCSGTPVVSRAITGDPAFAADGYHITAGSAAYNAGVASSIKEDIDGDTRPQFGSDDIGADELVVRTWLPVMLR
jgi:predicted outer membrane repeat protein